MPAKHCRTFPTPMPMSMSDQSRMPRSADCSRGEDELDAYVRAFELTYTRRGSADPAAFLPPPDHPFADPPVCADRP